MKIYKRYYCDGALHELRAEIEKENTGIVSIYQQSGEGMYGSKGKKVFGINWSALGTSSIKATKNYIKLIEKAIEEAEKMNK